MAYSVIAVMVPGRYYYTHLVGFICIHYYIMYVKKCLDKKVNKSIYILIAALSFVMCVSLVVIQNYLGNMYDIIKTRNLYFCTFINPLIIIMVMCIMCIAAFENGYKSKWVNKISSFSLLVYLLHANYFWLTYGKYWALEKLIRIGMREIEAVLLLVVCYTVFLPIISWIYEKFLGKITSAVSELMESKILNYYNRN